MSGARGCRRWRRAIWAEVDGSPSAAESRRLRQHLAGCPGCHEALEQARRLDRTLAVERLEAPRADFEERVVLGLAAGVESLSDPAADPYHPEEYRPPGSDPMEARDWWLVAGLGAVALGGLTWICVAFLPALLTVTAAAPERAAPPGVVELLDRSIQASTVTGQAISGFLRAPGVAPILMLAGILAVTLGCVRFVLARPAGRPRAAGHS
jgi:anti-sigma factor RsiW